MPFIRKDLNCYDDAAKAYRTPFVSGKDSLNNQFRREDGSVIEIPPTLLVTGVGVVEDVEKCVTMDLKAGGGAVVALPPRAWSEAGVGVRASRAVAGLIRDGLIAASHDVSEGGIAVTLAEMLLASERSCVETLAEIEWFGEGIGGYVLQVRCEGVEDREAVDRALARLGDVPSEFLGWVTEGDEPRVYFHETGEDIAATEMRGAFVGTLDW